MGLTFIRSQPWHRGYPVAILAADLLATEPSLTVLSTHCQTEAPDADHPSGQTALSPAAPSLMAHLHGIYMGSFHAWMHTASCLAEPLLCRDKGVCSVTQVPPTGTSGYPEHSQREEEGCWGTEKAGTTLEVTHGPGAVRIKLTFLTRCSAHLGAEARSFPPSEVFLRRL